MAKRFSHWLERQVGYEALLLSDRRVLHREAAIALEERAALHGSENLPPDDELRRRLLTFLPFPAAWSVAALDASHHWRTAGHPVRAALHSLLAARDAEARSSFADVARLAEGAVADLGPDGDALIAGEAHVVAGRARNRTSRFVEGLADFDAAAVLSSRSRTDALGTPGERDALRRRIHTGRAGILERLGRLDESNTEVAQALAPGDEAIVAADEAAARNQLGLLHWNRGRYEDALRCFEQTIELATRTGDRRVLAAAVSNAGLIDVAKAAHTSAKSRFEESLRIRQQIGDRAGQTASWVNLGSTLLFLGDFEGARAHFERGWSLARLLGDRYGEALACYGLGQVHRALGDAAGARAMNATALEISRDIGDLVGEARSRIVLAEDSLQEADLASCERESTLAIRRCEQVGSSELLCLALSLRATLRVQEGDPAGAQADADRAARIATETGYREGQIAAAIAGALSYGSREAAARSVDAARGFGDPRYVCEALVAVAQLSLRAGSLATATEALDEAVRTARASSSPEIARSVVSARRRLLSP